VIKVKNVRPGIIIVADAGLKLAPGEVSDVEKLTVQMQRCLDDGVLARVDETESKSETKSKSKSGNRASESKKTANQATQAEEDSKSQVDDSQGQLIGAGNDSQ